MSLIEKYSTLLFDLDGTLTDPKIGITRSVAYSLQKMGFPSLDLDSLVHFIGPPLRDSYKKYYNLDDAGSETAIAYYREYFSETGIFENSLYPGIDTLLGSLLERSVRLFVATSKPTIYARKICEHFAISRYFVDIEGSHLDGTLSNKKELIAYMEKKHHLNRSTTLMIGDREHDILAAKGNGIDSVGVGYGYGSRTELESAGATFYAPTIEDLKNYFTPLDEKSSELYLK